MKSKRMITSANAVVLRRIWCGTYNVNDKSPQSADDIQDWVQSCGSAELLVFS